MSKYFSPKLIDYGKSKDHIKGECAWGWELFSLTDFGTELKDVSYCAVDDTTLEGYCVFTQHCIPYGDEGDGCSSDSDCPGL